MTDNICHIDIETFSEEDLKSAGVYRYAEHPSTELLCLTYKLAGELNLWVPKESLPTALLEELNKRLEGEKVRWHIYRKVPAELRAHITYGGKIKAHNAQFERVVLNGVAGKKVGFPPVAIEQCICTAAKMAANGLPRALGDAASALGAPEKSGEGRLVMLQVSKPRKPTKALPDRHWTPDNAPDKFAVLYAYNVGDVESEEGIDDLVPDLPASEQLVWELDQRINDRGILVDLEAISNILFVVEEYKRQLAEELEKITRPDDFLTDVPIGTRGLKPTQRDKIAQWIRDNGYPALLDMQADTVKELIRSDAVPANVKRVLLIYSTYNAKAITKFQAMLDAVCADGRLRGMFLYHGAGTGRWSSLIVQLQNLFRPVISDPETAIEAFKLRDLDWIRFLYPGIDPIKVAASCVRSVLIASPGKDLLFLDYSGIEARVNAWFFDELWKLEAYLRYDTFLLDVDGNKIPDSKGGFKRVGPDLYVVAVSKMYNKAVELVTKYERQSVGKTTELAFGYEGGSNAMVTMAETYNVDLDELARIAGPGLPEEARSHGEWMLDKGYNKNNLAVETFIVCEGFKYLWRQAHPSIKQGWKDLKEAAERAVEFEGRIFATPNGRIMFKVQQYKVNKWLCMRLPSGRQLKYFSPRWIPPKTVVVRDRFGNEVEKKTPGELRFMGIDTNTRQWKEVSSYGGRWDENADQGFSRDLLVPALFALEAANYPVIGSVHDEGITEPDEGHGSIDAAGELMCEAARKVAPGLPVAVEGHRSKRYRK